MKRVICLLLAVILMTGMFYANADENEQTYIANQGLLIDDCVDFSVATGHSEEVYASVTADEDKYAFDDYTMFMRSTATAGWVEYSVPENQYLVFNTYFRQNEEISHFTFLWSKDAEIWEEILPVIDIKPIESWRWIPVTYSLNRLVKDAKYVRIVYGNVDGTVWSPAISSVYSRYRNENIDGFVDCVDTSFYEATAFLKNLGIISGVNGFEFKPFNPVTRAEFAKMATAVLNADISLPDDMENVFKDVDNSHWAYDAILSMWNLGILSGDEDGFFRPDDTITINEAVKILVSGLGYDEIANEKGGYPQGYMHMGKRIGITDGADGDGAINRGTAAVLFANTLNSEIVYQLGFGDKEELVKDGTTVLNKFHDTYVTEGLLTDVGEYSIISDSIYSEDTAVIGETEYKFQSENLKNLLGHRVEAYIKKSKNDATGMIVYAKSLADVTEITADKYCGLENGYICFEDEVGNSVRVKYDNNTRVIQNGRYSTRMGVTDNLDFTCGSMSLIKNSGKGKIDTVILWNYATYIIKADGKISGNISDKTGGNIKLNLDKPNKISLYVNGEETAFDDEIVVKADDVLGVAVSKDGYAMSIYISRDTLSGKITGVHEDYFVLNGKEILYADALSREDVSQFLGKDAKIYTDINGRAVFVEAEGRRIEYGYLQGVAYKDTFAKKVYLNIITDDGSIAKYYADEKTKCNDTQKSIDYISGLTPQLIRLVHEDQRVIRLETASILEKTVGNEGFSQNYKSEYSVYYGDNMSVFGAVYQLHNNTKIFFIPKDRTDISEYSVKNKSFLINAKGYNIELYDADSNYMIDAAVLYEDGSDVRVLQCYDNVAVITRVANILDSEGKMCIHLSGKANGNDVDIYFDNEGGDDMTYSWLPGYVSRDTEDGNIPFKVGEVIQYYMDEESHCRSFRMMLTEDIIQNNKFYENNLRDYGALTEEQYFSELYSGYGVVKNKFTDKIIAETVNGYFRTFPLKNATVYVAYPDKEKVYMGDASDISADDRIFVRMSYNDVKEIVVIK